MPFEPQNELESALVRATTDAAERPRFLREFLDAQIFLIREGEGPPVEREGMLQAGEKLALASWTIEGLDWLPVFSSLPRLEAALREPRAYLRMATRDFLDITRGANVVLNPNADYGKFFPAHEVSALLAGNLGMGEVRVAQQETKVLLGSPANMPQSLLDALTRLFQQRRDVKRAWVAHYHESGSDIPPHTLIGLEIDGDERAIVADAGVVAHSVTVPEPPVDIYVLQGTTGLADYFLGAKPFYRRKWLGIF
ncbi:MAG: enhanced serine sensitivity protein SseB C-terminal domain-containing protein [Tahibacter sp.]